MKCPNCGRTIYSGKLYKCDLCGDVRCGTCMGNMGHIHCLACHSGHYRDIKNQNNNVVRNNNSDYDEDSNNSSIYKIIRWVINKYFKYFC